MLREIDDERSRIEAAVSAGVCRVPGINHPAMFSPQYCRLCRGPLHLAMWVVLGVEPTHTKALLLLM